jgi:subtilisin family serine protease
MIRILPFIALSTMFAGTSHAADYVVLASPGQLAKATADAKKTGATVSSSMSAIDAIVVSSTDPGFAAAMAKSPSVTHVVLDITMNLAKPEAELAISDASVAAAKKVTPGDEFLSGLQWSLDAVDAAGGWAEGRTGAGVRVCVIDAGMSATHNDIKPNLNASLSASFVPGESWDDVRSGNHGTHVGGIIAAADNAYGTIGIAPNAELVSVKALSANTGSGAFSWIMSGMLYAADNGCDIANMSLGGSFFKSGGPGYSAADANALKNAMTRVVKYGEKQGTLYIASNGNSGLNMDATADYLVLPAMIPGVVAVSALGPQGWALDEHTDLDVPAFFTNYGKTITHVSGPGGNVDFGLYNTPGRYCGVDGVVAPCWAFDLVLAPVPMESYPGSGVYRDGWGWKAGTSMSAPAISGVAALICEDLGRSCSPGAIRTRLMATSDDLGKTGFDAVHGHGRGNSYEAVK